MGPEILVYRGDLIVRCSFLFRHDQRAMYCAGRHNRDSEGCLGAQDPTSPIKFAGAQIPDTMSTKF